MIWQVYILGACGTCNFLFDSVFSAFLGYNASKESVAMYCPYEEEGKMLRLTAYMSAGGKRHGPHLL